MHKVHTNLKKKKSLLGTTSVSLEKTEWDFLFWNIFEKEKQKLKNIKLKKKKLKF